MESKEHKWTVAKIQPSNTPQGAFAKGVIRDAVKDIEAQSYATHGRGQSYQMWFKSAENAREILQEAHGRVVQVDRAALVEVFVIDMDAVERRLIKSLVPDDRIQSLLPFQTEIVAGENYFHVVNASDYTIETKAHFIPKGATICARGAGKADGPVLGPIRGVIPTCPGCVAKSKGIIATHLQEKLNR